MPDCPPSPDKRQRRCPRLGHSVEFRYCRNSSNGAPCFKVFDCWWEQFDVVAYLKERLAEEEFNRLQRADPPNKVASLVDLIRQARERNQE